MSGAVRIEIGSIAVTGAPAALRDGAAFEAALRTALTRRLGDGAGRPVELDGLRIRLGRDASLDEIATALADAIAGAGREG